MSSSDLIKDEMIKNIFYNGRHLKLMPLFERQKMLTDPNQSENYNELVLKQKELVDRLNHHYDPEVEKQLVVVEEQITSMHSK